MFLFSLIFGLEEPSTYSVNWSSSKVCYKSLTKSSRHWALMGPCGSYQMLNSESSTAQDDIRPARSFFGEFFGWGNRS